MPEEYDHGGPDREELMNLGLDPNDPDFTELAAEGLTGDSSDDEDLSDAEDEVADKKSEDEE